MIGRDSILQKSYLTYTYDTKTKTNRINNKPQGEENGDPVKQPNDINRLAAEFHDITTVSNVMSPRTMEEKGKSKWGRLQKAQEERLQRAKDMIFNNKESKDGKDKNVHIETEEDLERFVGVKKTFGDEVEQMCPTRFLAI